MALQQTWSRRQNSAQGTAPDRPPPNLPSCKPREQNANTLSTNSHPSYHKCIIVRLKPLRTTVAGRLVARALRADRQLRMLRLPRRLDLRLRAILQEADGMREVWSSNMQIGKVPWPGLYFCTILPVGALSWLRGLGQIEAMAACRTSMTVEDRG